MKYAAVEKARACTSVFVHVMSDVDEDGSHCPRLVDRPTRSPLSGYFRLGGRYRTAAPLPQVSRDKRKLHETNRLR